MPKLPRTPARPGPDPTAAELFRLPAGTLLWRVHRTGGRHAGPWRRFRTYGPVANGRFDPHPPPIGDHPGSGILYLAGDIRTAIAEAFGDRRTLDRQSEQPYLVGVRTVTDAGLLDLGSDWPTRAGGSQLISSGPRPVGQAWARAIHDDLAVPGLAYPSSMAGGGRNLAFFERGQELLGSAPELNLPLAHPGLRFPLLRMAGELGYAFV